MILGLGDGGGNSEAVEAIQVPMRTEAIHGMAEQSRGQTVFAGNGQGWWRALLGGGVTEAIKRDTVAAGGGLSQCSAGLWIGMGGLGPGLSSPSTCAPYKNV